MSEIKYVATEKVTEDGKTIYHRLMGGRGRPARFVLDGEGYVPLAKPKKVKVAKTATPVETPAETPVEA